MAFPIDHNYYFSVVIYLMMVQPIIGELWTNLNSLKSSIANIYLGLYSGVG